MGIGSHDEKKVAAGSGIIRRAGRIFWSTMLLAGLCLQAFPAAPARGRFIVPGLSAALDRDSAAVGDIVTLTLTVRLPEGARLETPPGVGGISDLTIVGRSAGPGVVRIRLLVDRLGPWKTGPLSLSYVDKDGKMHELKTSPVSLKAVRSRLGDKPREARLRPIQGIMAVQPAWRRCLPWVAGGVALLLVAAVVVFRFRGRSAVDVTAHPVDPPHIRAIREIKALEAEGIFEKGKAREFYFRFSGILRRYLGAFRKFPAVEMTTEEIAARLEIERDRSLLPILRYADLVKFSDAVPSPAEKAAAVGAALSYIEATRRDLEKEALPADQREGRP